MKRQSGQVKTHLFLFLLLGSLTLLSLFGYPLKHTPVIFLSVLVFGIAFFKIELALYILIFSMFFSPEMLFGIVRGRNVVVRADDIFLLALLLGWLAKTAVNKELGLIRYTPLNRPIAAYLLACFVATCAGILREYADFRVSPLYFLKYLEYFLLFFLVTNNLRDYAQAKRFVYCLLLVALLISAYGVFQHFTGISRVSAPFEDTGTTGRVGESNTLGGYLVFIICVCMSFFFNSGSPKQKLFAGLLLLVSLPSLVFTLSRGSWLAFIPALITFFILTPRGKIPLLLFSCLLLLIGPMLMPRAFFERVEYTFRPDREYNLLGRRISLEESAAQRLDLLNFAFRKWSQEPLIGYGVGSSHAILDNQLARVLVEVGALGFLAFAWLLQVSFFNPLRKLRRLKGDPFALSLTVGFASGLVGLVFHSIGAETFILIRIMEPFWFFAAIVFMLPAFSPALKENSG